VRTLKPKGMVLSLLFAMAGWAVAVQTNAPLVVVGTRTERDVRDLPAGTRVLDAAAIRLIQPFAVEELLRTVPGVDLQGSGFPGSAVRLNMRGLTPGFQSKRVLVLVDGRRFNDTFQGNAEFALLPADGIERIEVLHGPASALYGSNAMGGVINIVTRRGSGKPSGHVGFLGGSYNTYRLGFGHGAQHGDLDYFIAGSFVDTDGYADNTDGTDRDWTAWNLGANAGWSPDEHSELRVFSGFYDAAGRDDTSGRDVQKDYEAAEYRRTWDAARDAKLIVRVFRSAQDDRYDWRGPGVGRYRLQTLGGEVQHAMWLTDRQNLTAGAEVREDRADVDELTGPIDETSSVVGAYLQDEIHLGEDMVLTAGVRADASSDYDTEISPRVGMLYRLSQNAEAYGSFNLAHRSPALSDRFVQVEFMGSLFVGNPDLDPETLTSYELGLRARPVEAARVALAVFYNDMLDTFDFMVDPDGVFRIRNVTASRTYGVEGSLDFAFSESISAFVNGSLTDGEYTEFPAIPGVEDNRLAYLAEVKAALGVAYEGRRCRHLLQCRYVGDRFGDAQNTERNRLDSYITVDWRSRVSVTGETDLVLRIDNVLDESYQDLPGIEQPGLTIMAGAEVRF